jgi:hypothetical protein
MKTKDCRRNENMRWNLASLLIICLATTAFGENEDKYDPSKRGDGYAPELSSYVSEDCQMYEENGVVKHWRVEFRNEKERNDPQYVARRKAWMEYKLRRGLEELQYKRGLSDSQTPINYKQGEGYCDTGRFSGPERTDEVYVAWKEQYPWNYLLDQLSHNYRSESQNVGVNAPMLSNGHGNNWSVPPPIFVSFEGLKPWRIQDLVNKYGLTIASPSAPSSPSSPSAATGGISIPRQPPSGDDAFFNPTKTGAAPWTVSLWIPLAILVIGVISGHGFLGAIAFTGWMIWMTEIYGVVVWGPMVAPFILLGIILGAFRSKKA